MTCKGVKLPEGGAAIVCTRERKRKSGAALATAGMLLDVWTAHQKACPQCRTVSLERVASIAGACLDGARKLKDAMAAQGREATS